HGFDVYPERHKPPYIALQHFAIRSADNVFPVSEHGRASLAARHPREAPKLEVMRLGTVMPAGCSVSSADGVLRVLTCSRLEEVKRVGLAVRALGAFAERWPQLPVEWTHIGDGAERESIENAAERLLPVSVKWVIRGVLPNASVREHYLESPVDVLLNVSSSEGVPVSMMEALSFGVPVVGTSVGGVPEIIDANTGILLPPDPTAEQIAEALHHFTERSTSVKRMRCAAREQWRTRFDGDRNFTEFVHRLLEAAPN